MWNWILLTIYLLQEKLSMEAGLRQFFITYLLVALTREDLNNIIESLNVYVPWLSRRFSIGTFQSLIQSLAKHLRWSICWTAKKPLSIFVKRSILHAWQCSQYASAFCVLCFYFIFFLTTYFLESHFFLEKQN